MKIRLSDRVACLGGELTFVLLLATTAHAAINISTQATQNMSCSAGVCTATAQKAYLNVNDVTTMLAAGDLKIVSGAGAEDIHIQAPFSWTSTSRLTLDAQRSIEFEKPVSVAGTGALTLITNDGGTGGDYWFDERASVSFWDTSSSLIINGVSFKLISTFGPLTNSKGIQSPVALADSYDASAQGTFSHPLVQYPFGSTFEGLGNTISNLRIVNTSNIYGLKLGVFAWSEGGTIRDFNLSNIDIEGGTNAVIGSITALNDGTVLRCNVTGTMSGNAINFAGGVVGYNGDSSQKTAVVANSSASVAITAVVDGYFGGVAGYNYGTVVQSVSSGELTDTFEHLPRVYLGGLVGWNSGTVDNSSSSSRVKLNEGGTGGGLVGGSDGIIANSHASGNVSSADQESQMGGLAGSAVSIVNSYATGSIEEPGTGAVAGGLAGEAAFVDSSFASGPVIVGGAAGAGSLIGATGPTGSINHSYATGAVTTNFSSSVGGVIGYKDQNATVAQVYAVGAIDAGTSTYIGGVVGENACRRGCDHVHARAGYWNLDTTGITDPAQGVGNVPNATGVTGLTDAQLKSALPAGFDPKVWGQDANINNGYPYLLANPPPKNAPGKARQRHLHPLAHRTPPA